MITRWGKATSRNSLFVIPAKAGIHHLTVNFQLRSPAKPEVPVMDSRFRGNDDGSFEEGGF
jgi:hypothetical protein